jgi:hypothetical protein
MLHRSIPVSLLVSSLISIGSFPSISRADMIPSGRSPVGYCFSITNLDLYPDRAFFLEVKSGQTGEVLYLKQIDSQGCYSISGYFASGKVFAQQQKQSESEVAPASTKNRIYTKSDIRDVRYMDSTHGVEEVRDLVKIKSVSATEVQLEYAEVIYTFADGKEQSQPYLTQDEKPIPNASNSPINLWYLAGSAIALGVIAIIYRQLKLRRKQTDRS